MAKNERLIFKPAIILCLVSIFFDCSNNNNSANRNPVVKNKDSIVETLRDVDDSILAIYQDHKNNFWFGSNGAGVYFYSNNKLRHYSEKNGLSSNYVYNIQGDSAGNIFFTTRNGICKFNGKSISTLKPVISEPADKNWKLEPGDLWFNAPQDSGLVYRYNGKELFRLKFPKTKEGEKFIADHPREKFPQMAFNPYDVYCTYKDRKGHIWFGTGTLGACRYDGNYFTWFNNSILGLDKTALGLRSIVEDNYGKFWFSNTLYRFDMERRCVACDKDFNRQKGVEQSEEQDSDFAYFMSGMVDNGGDLWLATPGKGVWFYNGAGLKQYPVKNKNENVTLFSIYKDRQGGIWLGTHTAGVYKFNGKSFEKYKF